MILMSTYPYGSSFAIFLGSEFPAMVEFAPYNKIPKTKSAVTAKRKDPKLGTLEEDPDYIKFVERMESEKENTSHYNPELHMEEIESRAKERANLEHQSTPLLEFIKEKRAEKNRIRDEKREARKKKDEERRRAAKLDDNEKGGDRKSGSKKKEVDRKGGGRKKDEDEGLKDGEPKILTRVFGNSNRGGEKRERRERRERGGGGGGKERDSKEGGGASQKMTREGKKTHLNASIFHVQCVSIKLSFFLVLPERERELQLRRNEARKEKRRQDRRERAQAREDGKRAADSEKGSRDNNQRKEDQHSRTSDSDKKKVEEKKRDRRSEKSSAAAVASRVAGDDKEGEGGKEDSNGWYPDNSTFFLNCAD